MAETQSEVVVEVVPENVPLPTSSMITVRLSDCQEGDEVAVSSLNSSPRMSTASRARSESDASSRASTPSGSSNSMLSPVDWEELEKTEEQEKKDDGSDEVDYLEIPQRPSYLRSQSTALLLARLERENAAIATDPKSNMSPTKRLRSDTRPPSMHHLKKLVNGPQRQSLRYSLLPAPQMTELEFWIAVVQDYPQTVERLPTLTANKIRSGVPPPLREQVWPSIAGARDSQLHADFSRLSVESSPYDGLIGKDVGRSFPNVEMFRERDGEGQNMLRRVLKAFSLYDEAIGYCQGLGFVVGPLLMHMSDAEAFCILVRLMEHYDLRSCYLPDLSGLHLRIYQFQALLTKHLPELSAHLEQLKIEPLYVSQWFLSFFAVTCPLPMLLRIYDVILSEGATETLMRVALSLMQRNQKKLMAFTEFEDAMQFLLSRSLWDTYAQHADDLVSDFVALTSLVSQDSLKILEESFVQSKSLPPASSLKTAAASLLGRFWTGSSHSSTKSALSLTIPGHTLRKSSSGQSLTSTLNSFRTTNSEVSTIATELSEEPTAKVETIAEVVEVAAPAMTDSDRDFHQQIEDLLTALTQLQRQQADLTSELQKEKEDRAEDRTLAKDLLSRLKRQTEAINELAGDDEEDAELQEVIDRADGRFGTANQRISIIQSKHELRDTVDEWKTKHDAEVTRSQDLSKRLDEQEAEHTALKESLREARQRVQDAHRDKQRLERTVQELRSRSSSVPDSPQDVYTPITPTQEFGELKLPPVKGLREFRLGRTDSMPRTTSMSVPRTDSLPPRAPSMQFSKRASSLNAQAVLSTENHEPVSQDALLLELVNAKTAEAVARQELEETRAKLDALRKIVSGTTTSPLTRVLSSSSPAYASSGESTPPGTKLAHAPSASTGGFFSGWGRRG